MNRRFATFDALKKNFNKKISILTFIYEFFNYICFIVLTALIDNISFIRFLMEFQRQLNYVIDILYYDLLITTKALSDITHNSVFTPRKKGKQCETLI